MPAYHIIVTGKVQGVFFRATAKKIATSLGLVGWVKNTPDEEVEIFACGDDEELVKFEKWCESGPPQAKVGKVSITIVPMQHFDSFTILK